jgi:hypothetical protein
MKDFQRLCAGAVLVLALAVPALAGHIPCPGVAPPPPEETATTQGQIPCPVTADVIAALYGLLFVL